VPVSKLLILVAIFFLTSLISVVTGSTSLITVPVMIEFGIDPHVAVATNMMALIFMSLGGSLPLLRRVCWNVGKATPSTTAKWRSSLSACHGVLEKGLTPPTLSERRCYNSCSSRLHLRRRRRKLPFVIYSQSSIWGKAA
jgi:hypothetical protein